MRTNDEESKISKPIAWNYKENTDSLNLKDCLPLTVSMQEIIEKFSEVSSQYQLKINSIYMVYKPDGQKNSCNIFYSFPPNAKPDKLRLSEELVNAITTSSTISGGMKCHSEETKNNEETKSEGDTARQFANSIGTQSTQPQQQQQNELGCLDLKKNPNDLVGKEESKVSSSTLEI